MKDFNQKYFTGNPAAYSHSMYRGSGYGPQDLNRPHIGIASTLSRNSAGHAHLRELAAAVGSAIWQAGGIPFEFELPSTCAEVTIGTDTMCMGLAMHSIVASGIEIMNSVQYSDGLVLLSDYDNIVPGTFLAVARPNIPAICCTGGPMLSDRLDDKQFLQCDVTEFSYGQVSRGTVSREAVLKAEYSTCLSIGACSPMGTANTIQIPAEILGMTLPGASTIPAAFTDKIISCKRIGRRIVDVIHKNLVPSRIITREAIGNAIYVDLAIGGSTGAIPHLLALTDELSIKLSLQDFEKLSHTTPYITDMRPSGVYVVNDLFYSGGVPAIFKQLESIVRKEYLNVSGQALGEILSIVPSEPDDAIRSLDNPIVKDGGLVILSGNLALDGCVVCSSTVEKSVRHFHGTAKVPSSDSKAHGTIIREKVRPGYIIAVRYCGPVGAPGMVEIMEATETTISLSLNESVTLIANGRFSGSCHDPIIGHISPGAVIGGTIALVEDGDLIDIDIPGRSLTLLVSDEELEKRQKDLVFPEPNIKKGFIRTYAKNCLPPEKGAAMQM